MFNSRSFFYRDGMYCIDFVFFLFLSLNFFKFCFVYYVDCFWGRARICIISIWFVFRVEVVLMGLIFNFFTFFWKDELYFCILGYVRNSLYRVFLGGSLWGRGYTLVRYLKGIIKMMNVFFYGVWGKLLSFIIYFFFGEVTMWECLVFFWLVYMFWGLY